jgi:hypothetical protein
MPRREIRSVSDIEALRSVVTASAAHAVHDLVDKLNGRDPLEVFTALKFEQAGRHPIEGRSLNIFEQVNQTFTYLASLAAAEQVLQWHPDSAPIRLNLGTSIGLDLESSSRSVIAEVFAAVRKNNNRKLAKDVERVARESANHKYVFFYCPDHAGAAFRLKQFPEVQIVPLTQSQLVGEERIADSLFGRGGKW